jgi:hypothetical protein
MEAGTPGQPITTKVSPSTKHLNYVNIWVGLYSSLVYITFHTTKDVSELLKSKEKFELWAKGYNITIKDIRADNGVYAAKAFQSHCMKHQQHMTFCAVGAHWQNRITKRFMGTITKRAHNKLFHTLAKLPSMVSKHLWLFAIHHSINYHNSTIHQGKTSCPHKLLTGEETKWKLQDFCIFSSPAFFNENLQDDNKTKQMDKMRMERGLHRPFLMSHGINAPHLQSGMHTHIAPQNYVVHDEQFQTGTIDPTKHHDLLDNLHNSCAYWLYTYSFSTNPYFFEAYWTNAE